MNYIKRRTKEGPLPPLIIPVPRTSFLIIKIEADKRKQEIICIAPYFIFHLKKKINLNRKLNLSRKENDMKEKSVMKEKMTKNGSFLL